MFLINIILAISRKKEFKSQKINYFYLELIVIKKQLEELYVIVEKDIIYRDMYNSCSR